MKVYVEFLGIPKIYINDQWIKINKNKLNLIILYILYNEDCTRDELSAIFWPENDEVRAKSNLRNALYQIRKILGEEILEIDGHSFIRISDKVELKKDIDLFLDEDNGKRILETSELIFMDKMYLKDNHLFTEWLDGVKRAYENLILNILNSELNNNIEIRNQELVEKYSNKIIELDPYNENAYREQIKVHILNHDFNEGIKIYKALESKVLKELEVALEEETIELYEYMIKRKNNTGETQIKEYFERSDLSLIISKEFDNFIRSKEFNHIIVRGEIGVGKSKLIESFLKNIKWKSYILELNQTITEIELLGFQKLLDLFNISGRNQMECLKKFLDEMKNREDKVILYIKNLEYIDIKSLDYFSELLLDSRQENIFIISELSESLIRDFSVNQRLRLFRNIINIDVPLLSIHETIDYIKFKAPDNKEAILNKDIIYEESFGNIMFIDEYIKPNKDMGSIIGVLLNSFNSIEWDILKKAAIFEDSFSIKDLNILMNLEELTLLNHIESLFNKGIFRESDNKLRIKYKPLKSKIYDNMPGVYKNRLHEIVANNYEDKEEINYENCKFLSYHYGKAGRYFNKYFYKLKSLELRLDYYDQFFPTIKNLEDKPKDFFSDRESYYQELNKLHKNINEMKHSIEGENFYQLIMILEFLMGRTMIGGGRREEGIVHIQKLIPMAQQSKDVEYLVKGYIEYIHYGIHKGSNIIIKEYIDLAKGIINREKFYVEYAELTRLEGLYELRTNNLEIAEKLLKESIEAYDVPILSNRNMFPIAAANNYLGNLYKAKKDYKTAEKYYLKSINTCLEYDVKKSLDIFYADYGYMLFMKNDYDKAEEILKKALEVYDVLGTHWKRSIVESSLGKIQLSKGDYKTALSHVRNAEIFSKKDQKSEEIKLLNKLKRDIKNKKNKKI